MKPLYHATPKANVEAILREGLRGGTLPDGEKVVCLAVNKATAHMSCLACRDIPDDDVAILEVRVDGLRLTTGFDGVGTWNYDGTIPPYRLKLL